MSQTLSSYNGVYGLAVSDDKTEKWLLGACPELQLVLSGTNKNVDLNHQTFSFLQCAMSHFIRTHSWSLAVTCLSRLLRQARFSALDSSSTVTYARRSGCCRSKGTAALASTHA